MLQSMVCMLLFALKIRAFGGMLHECYGCYIMMNILIQ